MDPNIPTTPASPNTQQQTSPLTSLPKQSQVNTNQLPKPGRAWYRFWASVIDWYTVSAALAILFLLLMLPSGESFRKIDRDNNSPIMWIYYILGFTLYVSYFVYFTYRKATTLGKDAYGISVISLNPSKKLTLGQVFVRELTIILLPAIPLVGSLLYLISGLMIIFRKDKRGIQDLIANTQVIQTRPPWKMGKQFGCLGVFIAVFIIIIAIVIGIGYLTR